MNGRWYFFIAILCVMVICAVFFVIKSKSKTSKQDFVRIGIVYDNLANEWTMNVKNAICNYVQKSGDDKIFIANSDGQNSATQQMALVEEFVLDKMDGIILVENKGVPDDDAVIRHKHLSQICKVCKDANIKLVLFCNPHEISGSHPVEKFRENGLVAAIVSQDINKCIEAVNIVYDMVIGKR
jgi:ABC-type sugar transport system substrate-binding protein